jgi:hypothetical protein
MRQKSGLVKEPAEKVVKDIRRATRRQFSAKEDPHRAWSGKGASAGRARPRL